MSLRAAAGAIKGLPNALARRPRRGSLVVPFMVDESREVIDFRQLDLARVARCARERRCGICGKRIKGELAFIGPDRALLCFGNPWMHPGCARYTIEHCPFVSGDRRLYRNNDGPDETAAASAARATLEELHAVLILVIAADGWASRDHLHQVNVWHFQPRGWMSRRIVRKAAA